VAAAQSEGRFEAQVSAINHHHPISEQSKNLLFSLRTTMAYALLNPSQTLRRWTLNRPAKSEKEGTQ
jgi:hypothetical protein